MPFSGTGTSSYYDQTISGRWVQIQNQASIVAHGDVQAGVAKQESKKGMTPAIYFKYIKKKFTVLENRVIAKRIETLEKAFDQAIANGQKALAEKFVKEVVISTRETLMFAKGVREYIERDDLWKYKKKIRGGHISDTKFEDFTRVIPDSVLKRKKEVEGLFDGYVIFHYWDEAAEKVLAGKQKMSPDEKSRMKDPVLFGVIAECSRMYFIAEWEDEFCDLTFDEMAGVIAKVKGETQTGRIEEKPTL